MSGVVKLLNLGGSIEATLSYASQIEKSTSTTIKDTFEVPPYTEFWICQRNVYLDGFKEKKTVTFWDVHLAVNDDRC